MSAKHKEEITELERKVCIEIMMNYYIYSWKILRVGLNLVI